MNSKSLSSKFGLIGIAVALVASVAVISSLPSVRIDLTEDNLYSLADGTRNILTNLEQPVELMFFYSESLTEDAPQIRSYGTRVQELLQEIVIASNGNLELNVIDPEPFSEDEDLATQYGVQAVPVSQGGQAIYFGLVAAQGGDQADAPLGLRVTETLSLIRPDQEEFLEYEFMKLISTVANPERPVVGLMTELSIDGGFDPATGQGTQQWMIMDIIRQLYEVRRLGIDVTAIDEDIDILLLVHPEGLSQETLYAIDQFVMRGGQTLLFLDPNADSMVGRSAQGTLIPAGMSSDLPGLLDAWGIAYDSSKVLTDSDLALRVMMTQGGRPAPHLGMLGAQRSSGNLAQSDIITSRLETINLSSAGAIAAAEGATTTFEPLIRSSANAMLMDAGLLENIADPSILFDEFESADQAFVIAARVTGPVVSAFPNGAPVSETPEAAVDLDAAESTSDADTAESTSDADTAESTSDADTAESTSDADAAESASDADDAASDAETESTADTVAEPETDVTNADLADSAEEADATPVVPHLSESVAPVSIIVYADTDMLTDRMWVQVAQFLGQRIPQPFANNGDLIINTLDNLSGGADLVSIRSRGRYSRPFTRVIDLQRAADDRLRVEESELLERLADTEAKLEELNQDENGQLLGQITPEIQAEIDQFNAELVATRRSLRDVQFQLTEDIEQLGTTLKAINTALVPILLTLLLLGVGYVRSQRRRRAVA